MTLTRLEILEMVTKAEEALSISKVQVYEDMGRILIHVAQQAYEYGYDRGHADCDLEANGYKTGEQP